MNTMLVLGHVTYHDFAFFRLPLPNQPGCWWLCLDGDGVGPGVPELLPFPVPLAVIPFELLLCRFTLPKHRIGLVEVQHTDVSDSRAEKD